MKFLNLFFALSVVFPLLIFSACEKEDLRKDGPVSFGKIILLQDVKNDQCVDGMGVCISAVPFDDPKEASSFPLNMDEVLVRPELDSDGRVVFQGTMSGDDLSQEAKTLLLDEKRLIVANSFYLPVELIRQAYEDAGMDYKDQRVEVEKGEYVVSMAEGGGANLIWVKICIEGSSWKICLEVTF